MFNARSKWGFPHNMKDVVRLYDKGILTLEEALIRLGDMYPSNISTVFTYGDDGVKIPHTRIEFGCPVVCTFTF